MAPLTKLAAIVALSCSVYGLELDTTSTDSIKAAASSIAGGAVSYYHPNSTNPIGILGSPYYFWEAGAFFDTLIQYWRLTGDSQYNDLVTSALQNQKGDNWDFMPANQTNAEGNDDQAFWALAALSAAEAKLPESSGNPTWFTLADNVFNEQVARWDNTDCNGGLRWQILSFMTGYDYKNSISNGLFFQLASRLARFTGNTTYSDWATTAYDWTTGAGFIDSKYNVYDGAHLSTNCTDIDKIQFSYTAGTFIAGAAHMYNVTSGAAKWKTALDGLLNATLTTFFPDGVAYEVACEPRETCTIDMHAMKGLLGHWLIDTIQIAPYTSSQILPLIKSTATAAASYCQGDICAFTWKSGGSTDPGLGNQIDALSYVQGLLVESASAPATGNGTTTTTGSGSGSGGSNTTATNSGSATPSSTKTGAGNVVVARWGSLGALVGFAAWLLMV